MPIELPHRGTFPASGTCVRMKLEGLLGRLGDRHRGGRDRLQQPAAGVHLPHNLVHRPERSRRRGYDQVGALGDDLQFVIGHQRGDLDDEVSGRVQPGHFQVHPHEHGADSTAWLRAHARA